MTQNETLIKQLAKLSYLLGERIGKEMGSIDFILPGGERWKIDPSEPPREIGEEDASDRAISFSSESAIERFLCGESNPQIEVQSGEWRYEGDPEYLMRVSEIIFELGNTNDS